MLENSLILSKNTPQKTLFTQIQSGKFKGKKLFLPNFTTTRSTKSRVKACVFNVLRANLAGKIFIEVFGGSGAMALEALSNGAKQAFIIEKDEKAYQIALKNAQNLGCENAKVFYADSFELLPKLCQGKLSEFGTYKTAPTPQSACQSLQMSQNTPKCEIQPTNQNLQGGKNASKNQNTLQNSPAYDKNQTPIIAYFDPPFHYRNDFADIYERIFSLICSLKSSNLECFIIEHSTQATMPTQISTFHQNKSKKFGNTTLTFYVKTSKKRQAIQTTCQR